VAILIDTSILIAYERGQLNVPERVSQRGTEEAFLSVISASELLHGVQRAADPAIRARRLAFVEAVLARFPVLEIDLAAARTHARTGLTIASHTGNTQAALEQFDILAQERVRPEAFIWVHAQSDWELESRVKAARTGAWIEIDNIDAGTVRQCAERVTALKQRGVLNRLLVSHDAGWYRPGEPKGGAFRGFETVYTAFVPALGQAGWTTGEVSQLLVSNPAAAFTVGSDPGLTPRWEALTWGQTRV